MTKGYTIQSRFGHYPYKNTHELFITRRDNIRVTSMLYIVTGYDYYYNEPITEPILIFLN